MQSGERPKLSHTGSGGATPLRERFGGMMRKRDGTGAHLYFFDLSWRYVNASTLDQPAQTTPRKLSLSSPQGPLGSPRDSGLPSPRTRGPLTPGFDGILNSGETWVSRRRTSESGTRLSSGIGPRADDDDELQSTSRLKIDEQEEEHHRQPESNDAPDPRDETVSSQNSGVPPMNAQGPEQPVVDNTVSPSINGTERPASPTFHSPTHPVPTENVPAQPLTPVTAASQPVTNPATVEWSYLDPQGQVQGNYSPPLLHPNFLINFPF
jgi:PERQ amino acid-rich with GYF domain-containing protein